MRVVASSVALVSVAIAGLVVLALAAVGLASVCSAGADTPPPVGVRSSPTPSSGGQGGLDRTTPSARDEGSIATRSPAPTEVPPTEPPAPTAPPGPAPTSAPRLPLPTAPATTADFSGAWRIVDTVTQGEGIGQTFSFDVTLSQAGDRLGGGNSGLVLTGLVAGNTALVNFVQPGLGLSGTFTWTMGADGNASGTFTSSVPNSGTSQLVRR